MDINTVKDWAKEIKDNKDNDSYYSYEGSGYECFVDDGIVCKEKWDKIPPNMRILVLLREAREQTNTARRVDDGIFSLTKYLTENSWRGSQTYGPVGEWINTIFDYSGFTPSENMENIFEYVAVANLKKTPGGRFCNDFKDRLCEQILEIDPHIIILSYEHKNFLNIMGERLKEKTCIDAKRDNINPLNLYICELTDEANLSHDLLVFDAYHPSARGRYKTQAADFEAVLDKYKSK